ncbi:MAG TPA: recombinase family protein, partial [Kribbellaceae bacterium]
MTNTPERTTKATKHTGGTSYVQGPTAGSLIEAAATAREYLPGAAGVASVTGREYLRVSKDRSGRSRSTGEQHDDNEREAARIGVSLAAAYRDDDRSASRYARKTRDDFEKLIKDLENDRFGADLLMLWESSRGSRKVSEWVLLIELCEQRGVRIHVTTHGRTYDPANGRDRRSLLEDSVDSEHEAWKISERTKRSMAANARDGKPHGRVPYGYRRRYDPSNGRLLGQEPDPVEAVAVRELFDRIHAGDSFRGIARDFAERGIVNRSGR